MKFSIESDEGPLQPIYVQNIKYESHLQVTYTPEYVAGGPLTSTETYQKYMWLQKKLT